MLVFISWVVCAWMVVGTIIMLRMLHTAFQIQYVQSASPAINDDDSAVRSFLGMLNEALDSLIICDDGDDSDGSLYNNHRVIVAVRDKLGHNPAFGLRCLFNCDDNVLFRRELANGRRVQVRILGSGEPLDGIHDKVIDGGTKASLSRHALGSKQRRYKSVDCTPVPPRYRGRVADRVLGAYNEDFEHESKDSASVN